MLGACSGSPTATPAATPAELHATGVLTSADGPNLANVTSFTLRTDAGEEIDFSVGVLDVSNGGLPAPHLREHLASGEPVDVTYHVDGGTNVADRYTDAGG